ncbi:MAG: succinate dehydrogenase assembly factor 2 [Paracoccaceae bacterium]|nr:succinate dehydrogenase assembly factor 2 [Paracoccaceae bacterium]
MDILEKKKKRLKIQSWRRGMKEMDLILGNFIDRYIFLLTRDELDCYEQLLQHDDQMIFTWIMNTHEAPREFTFLLKKISDFAFSKSKVIPLT